MKYAFLVILYLTIYSKGIAQAIYVDDFEKYEENYLVKKNVPYATTQNDSYVTSVRARSGKNSLLVKCNSSSSTNIIDYENYSGAVEIGFYIWVDNAHNLEISPAITFPFMRVLKDGYAYTFIGNNSNGPLNFKIKEWQKITLKRDTRFDDWSFFLNDELAGIGQMTQFFRSFVSINSIDGGAIFIDDVSMSFEDKVIAKNDIAISSIKLNQYDLVDMKDSFSISVLNKGVNLVEGINIEYTIDNVSYSLSNDTIKLLPNKIRKIILDPSLTLSEGKHSIQVEVATLSQGELLLEDNILTINAYRFAMGKKVPIFEYTVSSNYLYSPYAYVQGQKLLEKYDNKINVAYLHRSDAMSLQNYDYPSEKFLTLFINKIENEYISPYKHAIVNKLIEDAPLTIKSKVHYNKVNETLNCETKLTFDENYNEVIYHSLLIVEDSLVGDNNTYNQYNGYSNDNSSYLKEYFDKPPLIPYTDMIYRNVIRYALNGEYGKKIAATPIQAGEAIVLHEDLPFNIGLVNDRQYVYTIIMDKNRKVLNTSKARLADILEEVTATIDEVQNKISLYPNPCKSELWIKGYIDGDAVLTNVLGQQMIRKVKNNQVDLQGLPNGRYDIVLPLSDKTMKGSFIKAE